MSLTALEILKCARERLAQPKAWIQGAFYIDSYGDKNNGDVARTEATRYCSVGAILKCADVSYAYLGDHEPGNWRYPYSLNAKAATEAANALLQVVAPSDEHWTAIAHWQDKSRRRKKEVLAAFDEAITNLEGR